MGANLGPFENFQSASQIPLELNFSASQENIYQTHLVVQLLGPTQSGKNGALSVLGIDSSELNRDCDNALAMTFFGRMHHQPEVSHQGDLLYSKAILQLAGKLSAGNDVLSIEVLVATLTLTVHEVYQPLSHDTVPQVVGYMAERLSVARSSISNKIR